MNNILTAAIVAASLSAAGFALSQQDQTPQRQSDAIVPEENHLAVIAASDNARALMNQIARDHQLQLTDAIAGRLYTFYGSDLAREKAEALALKLKEQYQARGLIREAGLLGHEKSKDNPVLIPLELFVKFSSRAAEAEIQDLIKQYGTKLVRKSRATPSLYLLSLEPGQGGAAQLSEKLVQSPLVEFAHPNYWKHHTKFDTVPFDPFFADQWHHRNTGQLAGLEDADADTSWAWDFGMGDRSIVIAIADTGADTGHEDLMGNRYTNSGEIAGNGIDDDSNGYIDDTQGWDFVSSDNDPSAPIGSLESHGTAVAGVALARANNALGVAGACGNCSWMPLRIAEPFIADATFVDLFDYVALMDVDIMNNSWGHTFPSSSVSAAVTTAITNAADSGVAIFFAAGNGNFSEWCDASYPSLDDSVIAVSSSTNLDQKVTESAFGDCIDILAPSHRGYNEPYMGTANITTTDRQGSPGYNSDSPPSLVCPLADPADENYTHCFGGTSSASPLAAGIAGLLLSADGGLTRTDLQRLIQDTADKIVPDVADYDRTTGFSTPETHSYGRINAFEATRVVAPVAEGGRGGVDVFVRDNALDWGNTTGYIGEQASNVRFNSPRDFIGHWKSEDIKVDAPPYQVPPTAATFDSFVDEKPSLVPGETNRAYVRVRNRGPVSAVNVDVKLMWTQFGTALPSLNADFWTQFPNDSAMAPNPWTSMTCNGSSDTYCTIGSVPYSGASVATSASDSAQIARFDFPAPTFDPGLANHFCLLAVVNADNDPVDPISTGIFQPDSLTPNDNNITHRNYHDLDIASGEEGEFRFFVRNPFDFTIRTRVRIEADRSYGQFVKVEERGFKLGEFMSLKPREERLVGLRITASPNTPPGEVDVVQEYAAKEGISNLGGLTIELLNGKQGNRAVSF